MKVRPAEIHELETRIGTSYWIRVQEVKVQFAEIYELETGVGTSYLIRVQEVERQG